MPAQFVLPAQAASSDCSAFSEQHTFRAFSLICPHFGCTMGVASGSFACPCHGAKFASDGHWIGGPPTGNLTQLTSNHNSTSGTLTITP